MRTAQLLKRNLTYYWRTNLAVIAGVATAVAVLGGALLVGDSVRASLRNLFLQRLGNTTHVITAAGFFREQLAGDIQNHQQFTAAGSHAVHATAPLIALEGAIIHEASKRVGSGVRVYGIDEKFWKFHGRENRPLLNREILVSEGLARELGCSGGDSLLLQVQKPSEVPVESLHSRKADLGRTLRFTMRDSLAADALGEFSVQPQQSATRAVFVPLGLLQKELEQEGKVNIILTNLASGKDSPPILPATVVESLSRILKDATDVEDYGIKLRLVNDQQSIALEHESKLINDSLEKAARAAASDLSMSTAPILSYLANSISSGGKTIPYSLVTAIDEKEFDRLKLQDIRFVRSTNVLPPPPSRIILNEWAARDLGSRPGEEIVLEYYLWHEDGHLETKTAKFSLEAAVPMNGVAADRDLVPEYPGITESENLSDWDPPFPVDLKRIRKQDEDYWDQYRSTPKAFVPLPAGQELWQTRFGKLTSLRLSVPEGTSAEQALDSYRQKLKASIDPAQMGLSIIPARQQGLEASRGATNFGEYFLYFSFFLVVSALMLTALFFKLGVEQRLREIGVLQAVGFPASRVRKFFLLEGVMLSVAGSVIGLAGAIAYGQLMMTGLSTWWVNAVGTTMLRLHVAPLSLLLGGAGGIIAALVCITWTLRRLGKESTRSLLAGVMAMDTETRKREETQTKRQETRSMPTFHARGVAVSRRLAVAVLSTLLGLALLIMAAFEVLGQVVGFFGGGTLLLAALLCYQSWWLRARSRKFITGAGWWPVIRLGFRNATNHPGRSVLCIALIASAAFIIVSVDAFRRREGTAALDRKSGSGGFPLLAESLLPLVHDPNTTEGREALNLVTEESSSPLSSVSFTRFRVRPGDDASCLNLYQPRNPRIIAPTDDFIQSNRFAFANSLAESNDEKDNPWLLLNREYPDGATPVFADANSMTYVLHLKLGEDLILNGARGPVRLRVVGSLADSVFQSELLMGEKNFLRLFPEHEGYRFFLIDTPAADQSSAVAATLEDRLSDFGFDVVPTSERLANFHRVENTYLSTFQMLGGLGLLLGTLGLAAVLLRNVLERRRELALLRAVGYNSSHFTLMVIAENALLLFSGLLTGSVCALLAIAPVFFERGGSLPNISLGLLLLSVLISGLIASLLATWAALRSPLLPALRAE